MKEVKFISKTGKSSNENSDSETTYIEKITRFIILLYTESVTKEDVIKKLEISERTYFRYLKKLKNVGLEIENSDEYFKGNKPVLLVAQGGRRIMLQNLDFTVEEAMTFIVADKLVENFSDTSLHQHFQTALEKIRAEFDRNKRTQLNKIETKTSLVLQKKFKEETFKQTYIFDTLSAINECKVLNIKYYTFHKNETTEREIYPLELNFYRSMWHIRAFCCLKQDYREFRLDRIKNLDKINLKTFNNEQFTIKAYLESKKKSTPQKRIMVEFQKSIEQLVHVKMFDFNILKETETETTFQITFGIDRYRRAEFTRWLLQWGNACMLKNPTKILQSEMQELAQELYQKYVKNPR